MKILIIDDEGYDGFPLALHNFLKSKDLKVQIVDDPAEGIKLMNYSFDMVFIDFRFSKDPDILTGADVGMAIRKAYPLASLILMTAYGEGHIREFIWVGFDDYLPKKIEGETSNERMQRILDIIKMSQMNAQRRIKSKFEVGELKNVRDRLSSMKIAIEFIAQKNKKKVNGHSIAAVTGLLELGTTIDFKDETSHKMIQTHVNNLLSNTCNKKQYVKDHHLMEYRVLTIFFQLRKKDKSDYTENALKTRQLFLTNADEWKIVIEHSKPIKQIFNAFIHQ